MTTGLTSPFDSGLVCHATVLIPGHPDQPVPTSPTHTESPHTMRSFPEYDLNHDDEDAQFAWEIPAQDPIVGSLHTEALFVQGDYDQPIEDTPFDRDTLADMLLAAVEWHAATEPGTPEHTQATQALARAWEELDIAAVLQDA